MSYGPKKTTIEKLNHLKEIPEEELNRMRDILNTYIAKNRKKHYNTLRKSLTKRLGSLLDENIVEDMLQSIYVYAWTNIERVMEFYNTDGMDRYFNSIFYNPATTGSARVFLGKEIRAEINSEITPEIIDDKHYTNDALNPRNSLEERIEAHRIALEETLDYLNDNPHSKLHKALEVQKKRHGQKGYDVALNYITTPSFSFLMKNCRELGIHNVQWNIECFKQVCSEVYGKEILRQSTMPFSQF